MPIQLPSVNFLYRQNTDTIRCFPFELMFALIGTISAVALADNTVYGYIGNDYYLRLLMMSAVGLPMCLATSLFVQSKTSPPGRSLVLRWLASGLAVALFFVFNPSVYPQHTVHFALIFLALHLLISFAGFTEDNHTIAFWEFNRRLLSRFLTGLLYSLALGLGLTAAFTAANSLFGINMDWSNLYKIWMIIFGLFNTLFVLAGLPALHRQEQSESVYPTGLKLFSQYVLIPLATFICSYYWPMN